MPKFYDYNGPVLAPGGTGRFEFYTPPVPIVDTTVTVPFAVYSYGTYSAASPHGTVKGPGDVHIDILDAGEAVTTSAEVSRWTGAFTAANNTASKDFYKTDGQRVYVRIEDQTRKGQNNAKATIKALIRTLDIEGDQADIVRGYELKEKDAGSGLFFSEALVLVSNKVDDEFQAANVADGNPKDPTLTVFKREKLTTKPLSILVGGKLEARYDPITGDAPVANDQGAVGRANIGKDIKKVRVRPTILKTASGAAGQPAVPVSETREDFALMNVAWAQANIRVVPTSDPVIADPPTAEPFQDVGFVGGDPAFANNGRFDFTDSNGDKLHQNGEPSEPFTDSNGNGGCDYVPVNATDENGIPVDAGDPNKILAETRNLVDTLADVEKTSVDYIAVSKLNGSRGWAFHDRFPGHAAKLNRLNVVIVEINSVGIQGDNPRDFVVAAHELGHVITNRGHYSINQPDDRHNIMAGSPDKIDGVNATKRLMVWQVELARQFAEEL